MTLLLENETDRLARVGDFAGGAMMAVMGALMALIERGRTGKGQVIEVDMVSAVSWCSQLRD